MVQITDRKIKSLLKIGEEGRFLVGNGLYFRVTPKGTGLWVIRYSIHGKRREMSLGEYPDITLADANAETALIKREIKSGIDPLAERQRLEENQFKTVDSLAEDWLKDCEKRLKHPRIPRRVYNKEISPAIGGLALEQVTPSDIRAIIRKIAESGRPSITNDALFYCKQLFTHGIKLDLLHHNPAAPFTMSDAGGVEKSRNRALPQEELEIVFTALREHHVQFTRENYLSVALLVNLGVRKGELIAAKWEEFDTTAKLWHLPEGRSKTGAAITIPIPDTALGWLKELHIRANGSEYVFPARKRGKVAHISADTLNSALQKLHKEGKFGEVEHFTVHDLRRTCRSLLASIGVAGHVAERCLNHKLKGVEGIYDRYDYMGERREALDKLGAIIAPMVNVGTALF